MGSSTLGVRLARGGREKGVLPLSARAAALMILHRSRISNLWRNLEKKKAVLSHSAEKLNVWLWRGRELTWVRRSSEQLRESGTSF